MNNDDWEDEAMWEAQNEAAGGEHFEKQAREWVRDNALAVPALEGLIYARTLMPTHPRAVLVFGATSTELVIKNVLLRPLISGSVHIEDLALLVSIVVKSRTTNRSKNSGGAAFTLAKSSPSTCFLRFK